MSNDIERRVRADLRRRADVVTPAAAPSAEQIVALSGRRRRMQHRRRSFAMAAASVLIVVGGVVAIATLGTRSIAPTADLPPERCASERCLTAAASDDGRVVAIVHDPDGAATVTRVLTRIESRWTTVDANLPDDFVPNTLERHNQRWWVAGSVPGASDLDDGLGIRVPAVASSDDLADWRVQRLEWVGVTPVGFRRTGEARDLAFAGSLVHVLGPTADLVPIPLDGVATRTVCSTSVEAFVATVELCDGESLDVSVDPDVASTIGMRPVWAGDESAVLAPIARAPQFLGWEVVGSDGERLVAAVVRDRGTFASSSIDGIEWLDLGRLDCLDGSPGTVDEPSPTDDRGRGVVVGDCDGVTTIWIDVLTASPVAVTALPTTAQPTSFVVDDDGLVLDLVDARAAPRRFVSSNGVDWIEVDDAGGAVVAVTTDAIVVARAAGLDVVDRP